MRLLTIFAFATFGLAGSLSVAHPIHAEIVRNFELTIDRSFDSDRLPPVGTKGFGTLVFDESQIQYNGTYSLDPYTRPPFGYYALAPKSLSLDFFNRRYTRVNDYGIARVTNYFSFGRNDAGQYSLGSFAVGTGDSSSGIALTSTYVVTQFDNAGIAYGTVQLLDSEPIPEPSVIAGVPVALIFGWLSQRKRLKTILKTKRP